MQSSKKKVRYEMTLISYVDILGFEQMIETRSAGDISRILRLFKEGTSPHTPNVKAPSAYNEEFVSFSDLTVTTTTLSSKNYLKGAVFSQIHRLALVQAWLLNDEGLAIRGGVTVGECVKSHRLLFGRGIIRAYRLEQEVAKFPRIIVDDVVITELESNSALWLHDSTEDKEAVLAMLVSDEEDNVHFIDYLRVAYESVEPLEFENFFSRHERLIRQRLDENIGLPKVLAKYEWLLRYHRQAERRIARLSA